MKQHWLAAFLFFALGFVLVRAADTPPAIASLMATIQKASETHDLALIKSLYDLDGASDYQIDLMLSTWQENWNEDGDTHWVFEKVEYRSLAEIQADKTMNQRAINSMLGPKKMGEHTYVSNLEIVGFINVSFKDNRSSTASMEAVGLTPDGTAKIVLRKLAP